MVPVTWLNDPGCSPAATVHPPTSSTGAPAAGSTLTRAPFARDRRRPTGPPHSPTAAGEYAYGEPSPLAWLACRSAAARPGHAGSGRLGPARLAHYDPGMAHHLLNLSSGPRRGGDSAVAQSGRDTRRGDSTVGEGLRARSGGPVCAGERGARSGQERVR